MNFLIHNFATRARIWLQSISEVARFDGIFIADLRNRGNQTPHFQETILAALQLLKATDLHRYCRVRRHISWVTNLGSAIRWRVQYSGKSRTCDINFLESSNDYYPEFLICWCAMMLVHEATYGEIKTRRIQYTPALRSRIEQLCVKEEHKFLRLLSLTKPELAEHLYSEFDPVEWEQSWNSTRISPHGRFAENFQRV